jgi:zinc transporter ZupT
LAAASNSGQIAVATLSAALVWLTPSLLPWILGAAVGSLSYLVMVDLLPRSYSEVGKTAIALVTLGALAMVALVGTQS